MSHESLTTGTVVNRPPASQKVPAEPRPRPNEVNEVPRPGTQVAAVTKGSRFS